MPDQVVVDLFELRSARVFFLHHSVGQNILDAVERLDGAVAGGRWPVVDVDEAMKRDGGALIDVVGGTNAAPTTKVDAFVSTLLGHPGLRADVALMKFCYVDFAPDTDVDALFAYYRDSVRALRALRPGMRLVHSTVPLKARPVDVRARVRRALRLQVFEDAANQRRAAFNARLREAFAADPIFDLAALEARGPDAHCARERSELAQCPVLTDAAPTTNDGDDAPALHPRFTDDGGHLNPTGARVVAVAWLHFLADVVRATRAVPATSPSTSTPSTRVTSPPPIATMTSSSSSSSSSELR